MSAGHDMQNHIEKYRLNALMLIMLSLAILMIGSGWWMLAHPLVGIAIAFIPLALLLTFQLLFWLVLMFILFSFFRIHEAIPALMPLKLPLLFSLGSLVSISWHLLISRRIRLYWHPSMLWLLLFWFMVIGSIVFASNRDIAVSYFTSIYCKIMIMTLAIIWIVDQKHYLKPICWLIIAAGMLIATITLNNAAQGIGLVEGSRATIGRDIGSTLGDPNDLALVLLFPMSFSLSLFFSPQLNKLMRVIGGLSTLLLTLAIIATQSRGGLLGMLAVYGYFASQLIRSKLVLAFIGLLGALILHAVAGISDRASGGAAEEGIDESAMGRLYAWQAAFNMALDNPGFGVGLENFYYNYFFYSAHWDGLNHAVHSTWFGVLAEIGFVGLFVFIALVISLVRSLMRSTQQLTRGLSHRRCYQRYGYLIGSCKAVLAGLLGTIVSGTFLTQGFVWPIYILAALAIALSRLVQIELQNANKTAPSDAHANKTR